jgi:hypothetical protein
MSIINNLSSMDKTPEKVTRRRLFEPTSPAKPAMTSPDPMRKRVRKEHTGYTDTERESEFDRKYKDMQFPIVAEIRNNFIHPVLVLYPLSLSSAQRYEAIKSQQHSKVKNTRIAGGIVISANNKIHTLEYVFEPNKQFFLDTIDDELEKEWETAKEVEIEIDKDGNLRIKPVKQ